MRQRFGIAAPRVAVHTHDALVLALAAASRRCSASSAASAVWIYDAGRRFAGFDRSEVQEELSRAAAASSTQRERELERLRAVANAADSRLSIERTAQQKLAQQMPHARAGQRARCVRNSPLFESMLTSDARNGHALAIYRFKVEPDVLPGEYRYRLLLLTPSARRERDFNGRLELVVSLQEGGAML